MTAYSAPDRSFGTTIDPETVISQIRRVEDYLFSPAREEAGFFLIPDLIDQLLDIEEIINCAESGWGSTIEDLAEVEFHALAIGDIDLAHEISRLKELLEPNLTTKHEFALTA